MKALFSLTVAALLLAALPISLDRDASHAEEKRNPELLTAHSASVFAVLKENPLERGETVKVTPLSDGYHSSVVVIQLAPGAQVPGHYHLEHDEFIQVVRGEVVMVVGRERLELSAGSLVHVPAGISHGARAIGNGCAVVSTYAPVWDPKDRHADPKADVLIDSSGDSRG